MIRRKTTKTYRHNIENKLGKDPTGKEVLDYLLGDCYNDYQPHGDYTLVKWVTSNTKWWQRINYTWVVPLTLILAPFKWVMFGTSGWSNKNSVGRFILKCVGELRE